MFQVFNNKNNLGGFMKLLLLFMFFLLAVTMPSYAGFEGLQSTTSLKVFNRIRCSTGLTCTRTAGGTFNMVSSPTLVGPLTLESGEILNNTVDDTVELTSNDEALVFQLTGFEAKAATLNLYPDQGDDDADKFSINATITDILEFRNNGTAFLSFSSAGAMTATSSLTGDGGDSISGFLEKQVTATATTITAAQCGSTFINAGAIEMELPEASTVLGCQLTFIVGNASNFTIDPDAADQLMLVTDAAGDSLIANAIGESIVIQAISASAWAPVSAEKGTWTDSN
jgi:hypothetical protein